MEAPKRLRGMQDQQPDQTRILSWVGLTLGNFLDGYGYRRIDTPLLEETELFLRKSGGELASKMYTFTDPGGRRVSLRPEFTSSVVRAHLQGLGDGQFPLRWQYRGPVFRYEMDEAEYRQFTQAGAELIGAAGPWSDAEVMAIACQGLARLGIKCQLVIGHVGFMGALLEEQRVSDRAGLFLLNSISDLRRGDEGVEEVIRRAGILGLSQGDNETPVQDSNPPEDTMSALEQYLGRTNLLARGVRTPTEIHERFIRKHRSRGDFDGFDDAAVLLSKVARKNGSITEALGSVREMELPARALAELERLEESLKAFAMHEVEADVVLDFGLARGIAYYSDLIFDLKRPGSNGVSLGGGGRYDGLARAMGGTELVPTMGFAWSLERVVEAVIQDGDGGRPWEEQGEAALVRPAGESAFQAALREADRLRSLGGRVHSDVTARSLEDSVSYARKTGISRVITVEANGEVSYQDV